MGEYQDQKYSEQIGELNATMKIHGDRLDDITHELRTMNSILIRNTEQLEIHIKRTQQNEDAIRVTSESVDKRLQPIERHVVVISTYGKVLVAMASAPAILYYVIRFFTEIFHK